MILVKLNSGENLIVTNFSLSDFTAAWQSALSDSGVLHITEETRGNLILSAQSIAYIRES